MGNLRNLLEVDIVNPNECYHRIVENIRNLPSLPNALMKLMDIVNSSETSADDVARILKNDPALTGAVLRAANSSFYGVPRSISSVTGAIVILGFNTLRSLVLSHSVMKTLSTKDKSREFNREQFWFHSIVCGVASKTIAQRALGPGAIDPESAFCAGI